MALEWVDELPPKRPQGQPPVWGWEAEEELRRNPGRWARLAAIKKPQASTAVKALVKRGFEAEWRHAEDPALADIYARQPGQPKAEPTPIRKTNGRTVGYPCDHCDEELDTPAALKHHVRRHHPDAA